MYVGKTALTLKETAQQNGEIGLFEPESTNQLGQAKTVMQRSRNRQLQELFPAGFGNFTFHSLLPRIEDPTLVESGDFGHLDPDSS